jgi:protein SCO1/2
MQAVDFTLTDQNGQPFTLSEQRGKVVVMFFGYTNCPDVCPTTLAQFVQIKRDLKDQAKDVLFGFVTVDPERDTPDVLKAHLSHFDSAFFGLTGSLEQIQPVWKAYFISVQKEDSGSATNYSISHTAQTFVIDRQGKLVVTYDYGTPTGNMTSDLKNLMKEKTQ